MVVIFATGDVIVDYGSNTKALIVQQNNCTGRKVHEGSFAASISAALGVDPYALRASRGEGIFPNLARKEHREKMGDVSILGTGENTARVACLFAQYKMGLPNSVYYRNSPKIDDDYKLTLDDKETRLRTFRMCLEKLLAKIIDDDLNVDAIVFPEKIGCNRAGGDWSRYLREIERFANQLKFKKNNVSIIICKLQK